MCLRQKSTAQLVEGIMPPHSTLTLLAAGRWIKYKSTALCANKFDTVITPLFQDKSNLEGRIPFAEVEFHILKIRKSSEFTFADDYFMKALRNSSTYFLILCRFLWIEIDYQISKEANVQVL